MIVACPNCNALYRENEGWYPCVEILGEYTDGRVITDLPAYSLFLFYCPICDSIARIQEARVAGRERTVPFFRKLFVRAACVPPPLRYLQAIQAGLTASIEEEVAFRLEAWRGSNDPIRDLPDHRKPLPEARPPWWRENLRALQQFLDPEDDKQALLLGEIERELGSYSDCLLRISAWESATSEPETLGRIKHFAGQRNPFVQRVY
jgi:hypothetical protein